MDLGVPPLERENLTESSHLKVQNLIGGNQTYLEKDVHPWVGSTDPAPITMCITPCTLHIQIHIIDLARGSSTNFQLYYFVIQICSTNWLGHGHGYKWHSSYSSVGALVGACLDPPDLVILAIFNPPLK